MFLLFLLFPALAFTVYFVNAVPMTAHVHSHSHDIRNSLGETWYHAADHPTHTLFKRDPPGDGQTYPLVGSPTWRAAYPASSPNVTALPKAWVDALNAATAAGKIANISQTGPQGGYPPGVDPASPAVCAASSFGCRHPEDVWDVTPGFYGTGFDDGPLPASMQLGKFLQQNNETATHFIIGTNVLYYPDEFIYLFNNLSQDIAVHTWTHPYMTRLNNLEILGQLGWSMQLIHDSTGGRLPRFWRPPYGDSDNRVRSIAREVFGLRTIYWNHDTGDWSLTTGGSSLQGIAASFQNWATGPKSPGLIVLEHELTSESVTSFINAYPVLKSNGWQLRSVAQLAGNGTVYQNSQDAFSPVTAVTSVLAFSNVTTSTSSSTSTTPMPASVSPSVSMLPHQSSARRQFGITAIGYLAITVFATVVLASPTCH